MDVCIVYLSSSVGLFEEQDLSIILEQSRRNNGNSGVTGVMLYVRGSIVQVLEGEKDTVETLYGRIEQDRRHKDVIRVLNRPIEQRLFSNWTMGYETITARQLKEINNVVNLDTTDGKDSEPLDNIVLKTIKLFYESNRHN